MEVQASLWQKRADAVMSNLGGHSCNNSLEDLLWNIDTSTPQGSRGERLMSLCWFIRVLGLNEGNKHMQERHGDLVFSATDIAGFLECEHLMWLDLRALSEPALRAKRVKDDESSLLLADKGIKHEKNHLARQIAEGETVVDVDECAQDDRQAMARLTQAVICGGGARCDLPSRSGARRSRGLRGLSNQGTRRRGLTPACVI